MKDFSSFPNTNNSFPSVTARNATSPSVTDGTPLLADIYNDVWGFFQACLNAAGITPSDVPDTYNNSQVLESLINILSPVGTIFPMILRDDPANLGLKVLKLTSSGSLILIADYPELVDVLYVGNADNDTATACYKCDADGTTRNTNGLYFRLPSGSRKCLRDPSYSSDPNYPLLVGESGSSYMQDHTHRLPFANDAGSQGAYQNTIDIASILTPNPGTDQICSSRDYRNEQTPYSSDSPVANAIFGDFDLSPEYLAVNWYIRY